MVRIATLLTGGVLGVMAQTPADPPRTEPRAPLRLEDFPPAVRLGARVEGVRRNWAVLPIVVVVADEVSYIEAIAGWTHRGRYPVLMDDGTERAREDIARFVRAFGPERVMRWSYAQDQAAHEGAEPKVWPAEPEKRRAMIEDGLFRVWAGPLAGEAEAVKIAAQGDLVARWNKAGVPIPGIIAADAGDSAWTAALALAAGRCEPLAWIEVEQGVNGTMAQEKFEVLEMALEAACDQTGLTWRKLGDEIDGVTLCLNCPVKVQLDPRTVAATTDLLARHPEKGAEGKTGLRDKGDRWAWAGQVFGTQAQAAYCAMSALFLMPRTAWVFDGYPDTKPWNQFDGAQAGKILNETGLNTIVDDSPKNGEKTWRSRCGFGVDAGFIAVNSKGMADEFNLEPGQCRPGEVPFLKGPSIVYMVHSWSAAAPAERGTVAGRWLERGAYAMLGSTYEPFLPAFVPTPTLCARLASAFPWGAAVRSDTTAPAWKLATIGDPLITFGPQAPRTEERLPLMIVKNVAIEMRDALTARKFEEAIIALTLLGRDDDAAKLGAALRRDEPAAFTAKVAAAVLLPAMRARDADTVLACYAQFSPEQGADPVRRDALWHACWLGLTTNPSDALLQTLRTNLRPDQIGQDAAELMRPIASRFGRDTATVMLNEARPKATTDYDRKQIDEVLKTFMPRTRR